jgi:glycosyltransferase involved in cell wall biosynthesis
MRRRLDAIGARLVDIARLPQRAWLTLRWRGGREFVLRALTFPLRLLPFARRLAPDRALTGVAAARAWYGRSWRPVTVVVVGGESDATAASLRRTCDPRRVQVATWGGRLPAAGDVVLLAAGAVVWPGWLEALQYATERDSAAVAGPRLLRPDGAIRSAGLVRDLERGERFRPRYAGAPGDHPPAAVAASAIALDAACVYLRREALDAVGPPDTASAAEVVELCLRAWDAGMRVRYEPHAAVEAPEDAAEVVPDAAFWERWTAWLDDRPVRTDGGRLRIVYVTEVTSVSGGNRVIFEHLNRLAARGHHCELYSLEGPPDWFDLRVPVRAFGTYDEIAAALRPLEALKVATWWATGAAVWEGSVRHGIPLFLAQDIETGYYPDRPLMRARVMAGYREEFRYWTDADWTAEQLRALGLRARTVPPGVDLDTFHELDIPRDERVLLSLGRTHPLKNFPLTAAAWRALGDGRPELWLFGIEPELAEPLGARYFAAPSDAEVNELLNRATVLVQTSRHEGFCLPLLEAMAAGAAVVCTDAHGNRDFCRDGENCLVAGAEPAAVAAALRRLFDDRELRESLVAAGRRTAAAYAWDGRIDELERFLESLAPRAAAARA